MTATAKGRLRIALVSQEYPPETGHGGIGRQTQLKARGLSSLGHEVIVVSAAPDGRRSLRSDGGAEIIRIAEGEVALPALTEPARWLARSTAVAAELAALDDADPLDLIDFPEWAAEGFVALVNRPDWRSVPTVIQLHGPAAMLAETIGWPEPGSAFHRAALSLEGGALRLADAVYSSSAWSAGWAASAYGLDPGAIPVIHTGVDLATFRPRAVTRSPRPTIVFVGRVAASKGVGVLVEAAVRLAPAIASLRVRVVGRDPDGLGPHLQARAVEAGHRDLVELVGPLEGDDLVVELCAADVFAAPSRSEGGPGFTFLEAMACGLPVVGPAGTGVAEVVDAATGVLVPPDDPDALAAALLPILTDPAGRNAMGLRARAHVVATADTRACIERLEAFYLDVVRRFGPADRRLATVAPSSRTAVVGAS